MRNARYGQDDPGHQRAEAGLITRALAGEHVGRIISAA